MTNEQIKPLTCNKAVQREIDLMGFAVIPGLYKPVLDDLWKVYNAFPQHFSSSGNVFASTAIPDKTYRKKVDADVFSIVKPVLDGVLNSYQLVYSNFLTKLPGTKSNFHLHQDLTIVDEDKFRAYNFWSPLTNATRQNGCLEFVAGSHLFLKAQRGRNLNSPISSIEDAIDSRFFTPVELNPGDVVVFDTRLLHRSQDNLSHSSRTGVSTVVAHKEASLMHYVAEDYNLPTFKVLKVESGFFTDFGIEESITGNYETEIIPATNKQVTIQEFANLYYQHLDVIAKENARYEG